jgi:hypothetical protein
VVVGRVDTPEPVDDVEADAVTDGFGHAGGFRLAPHRYRDQATSRCGGTGRGIRPVCGGVRDGGPAGVRGSVRSSFGVVGLRC